ncbi:glycoside hydrolase family 3 protein [Pelagovum pacificum]|uniref:beta-N-acetylhexosaminidase n=1 Tax=Pelagovum pacificum TaxID=2588711 RepID=A0A5C5GCS2_9RHOB|nr:glycoside hydrolase family 3 N-terminal domain-containing protein [Pelagovum pacificum]QQA41410.1 glycoside hydrolase family 3 protein [Pelagovum pacificum]TNY31787.1 glycoside hydrolase family 3 protein [Pelagovum pacificum]
MDDFTKAPFNLDREGADWVEDRLAAMSDREKMAQCFNVMLDASDSEGCTRIAAMAPGSVAIRGADTPAEAQALIARFDDANPVPLLVTADLEGSLMTPPGASPAPNPLGFAAIDEPAATEQMSRIMAHQAAHFGINWSFTPCIDINARFRSAIVGTRSFGSDPAKIRRHALAHVRGLASETCAATAKHFPGEGYDERDQHLVTTVNPLSMAEWEETYGKLYRTMFEEGGVMAVMPGHIALPSYMREVLGEKETEEHYQPATVNRHLIEGLLRKRLGFRGIVVSDASEMAGLTSWMTRAESVVAMLNAGCDIVLFTSDFAYDLEVVEAALADGRLSWARIEQAIRRQLALKAAVGLHRRHTWERPARDRDADDKLSRDLMRRLPTLVRDRDDLLPLSPETHRKILLVSKGVIFPFAPGPLPLHLPDQLRTAGFEVTEHDWGTPVDPQGHDLILYCFAEESLLTRGTITLDWFAMHGSFKTAMRRPHDVPSLMVSFGHPYYLYEVTRMPCYINAYSSHLDAQQAVVDALTGKRSFEGKNPVDPFCGLPEFV